MEARQVGTSSMLGSCSYSHTLYGLLISQRGVGKDANVSHIRRWLKEDLKNPDVDEEKVETFAWFFEVEDILAKSIMNRSLSPKAGRITEDANKGKRTSTDQIDTLQWHNTSHPVNKISYQGRRGSCGGNSLWLFREKKQRVTWHMGKFWRRDYQEWWKTGTIKYLFNHRSERKEWVGEMEGLSDKDLIKE